MLDFVWKVGGWNEKSWLDTSCSILHNHPHRLVHLDNDEGYDVKYFWWGPKDPLGGRMQQLWKYTLEADGFTFEEVYNKDRNTIMKLLDDGYAEISYMTAYELGFPV